MRCAIYARVSTELGSQKDSVNHQVSFFNRYVEERRWSIFDIYKDEGVSGTSIKGREEIIRLLRDARAKRFEYVLFKSISRFARDIQDGINMKRELDSLGIGMIFIEQNIDTKTADGELMFSIHLSVAQQESEQISKRVKFGKREKAAKGKFNGSLPPFGYKRIGNQLGIDPDYSCYVKEIFRLYLYEDWGLQRIAKLFTKRGVPTPRKVTGAKNAGKLWQQSTVKIILTNPMYTGNMVQNRSEVVSIRTKLRKKLDTGQQTHVQNTHPAIISLDEFEQVQEKLKRKGTQRSNGQESLFAHIAVCADCGSGMHYKNDRKAYQCGRYGKYGRSFCSNHLIRADKLLSEVLSTLKGIASEGVNAKKLMEMAKKEAGHHKKDHETELRQNGNRLMQLTKKRNILLDLLNDDELTKDEWRMQNDIIREESEKLTARKIELESLIANKKDTDYQIRAFEKQVSKLLEMDIDNEKVLKQVLHRLIHKIEVYQDSSIKIHFNFMNPHKLGA
ncbi:recombinase family protein [Paenibacillus massiliensis]|uniref:recombinase family protein n=1 Tax=Paenibacillus massiliensis TaxID=225917 RepID=UPI0003812275|nr:recombinase family protein [Paenibacillus massiliensis]